MAKFFHFCRWPLDQIALLYKVSLEKELDFLSIDLNTYVEEIKWEPSIVDKAWIAHREGNYKSYMTAVNKLMYDLQNAFFVHIENRVPSFRRHLLFVSNETWLIFHVKLCQIEDGAKTALIQKFEAFFQQEMNNRTQITEKIEKALYPIAEA